MNKLNQTVSNFMCPLLSELSHITATRPGASSDCFEILWPFYNFEGEKIRGQTNKKYFGLWMKHCEDVIGTHGLYQLNFLALTVSKNKHVPHPCYLNYQLERSPSFHAKEHASWV